MKPLKIKQHFVFSRRSLLKTVIGILGSLSLPIHANPDKPNRQQLTKEAAFYHKKDRLPDNEFK